MHFSQPQFWTKIVFLIVIYRRPFSVDSLCPVHQLIVTPETPYGTNLCSTSCSLRIRRDKGRTIRYLGGGLEFLLLANFFFTSERKQSFFWRSTSDNFFLCFVEYIFCRMLSLLCTLPFGVFSGQHIFHQFRQQTFFLPTFSTNFFFLTLVATNYFFQFFSAPPPPDIKWCVPNIIFHVKQNIHRHPVISINP